MLFAPIHNIIDGLDWSGRSQRRALWGSLILFALPCIALMPLPVWRDIAGYRFDFIAWFFIAALLVSTVGHILRRLNDLDLSGKLFWLLLIPFVDILFLCFLLLKGSGPRRLTRHPTGLRIWGLGLTLISAVLIAVRAFWVPVVITDPAMKPGLLVGDIIAVRQSKTPVQRGQVVVFRQGHTLNVGRVIGRQNDEVTLNNGVLSINAQQAELIELPDFVEKWNPQGPKGVLPLCSNGAVGPGAACLKLRYNEGIDNVLPGHDILDIVKNGATDSKRSYTVPQGHYFILGDNRDNAADSRFPRSVGGFGFVAQDDIIGSANLIVFSFQGKSPLNVLKWRLGRTGLRVN